MMNPINSLFGERLEYIPNSELHVTPTKKHVRAPTLHRLGIQAFLPLLVEGRAICLHPLVCKGFNADFDGDQMAVHVPLSLEAQAEARLLMFSHMTLLSPTIGDPISAPTQDMLSGLYVLTSGNRRGSPLWLRWRLDQRVIAAREAPIEIHYESLGTYYEIYAHYLIVLMAERPTQVFHNKVIDGTAMKRLISRFIDHYGIGYTSHILDQVKTLGFRQATAASISLGIDDLLTIPSKRWLVQDAEQQSFILEKHHHYGNVHAVEKLRQSIEIWYATSEYLRQEMTPNFRMTDPFNPVHIMSFSGARGNASQVHQLVDTGYLTCRLVEVVQHIVVRRTDCGTVRGISVSPRSGMMADRIFIQTLIGRVLADDIYIGSRCIATRNQDIGVGLVNRFITFRAQPISIRTPFTCRSTSWICQLCYGRSPAHDDLVELGEAVGIIAGQSIGEPGTQLTLRTFHTGGVFTGGTAEHVRAPSNGKIKFNEDLVHPTRTRHGHPAFLCSRDLKWNPKMAPYISAKRKGIHITNLTRTARFLSEACDLVFDAASRGKQFLIVGTKNKEADSVAWAAIRARCHYVNKKWLGGMLTNWSTTETRLHKFRDLRTEQKTGGLNRLPKRDAAMLKRQLSHLQTYLGGIKYMTGLPDIVIIVDQHEEYTALQECITLGIPTICLIDTNCDPDLADISIPANDDAISSIRLIPNKLVFAICEGRSGYIRNP
ncbi:hypothetical protein E3N88_46146 [Mikania micrantha]|uniref:Small ribosomal subunit protein uS2c n=1 Tax=Mikania micrantha TaxID=192012 RepID=A0A5N6L7E2_9ASTR|nr:hypothetical protein E3N88_46146 [Mikania micrantha]